MNEIQNAARAVAELEAAATTAADELAAANRRADTIRDRRAALLAERDSIATARRAGGDVDGGRLAVIGLDVEGLDACSPKPPQPLPMFRRRLTRPGSPRTAPGNISI